VAIAFDQQLAKNETAVGGTTQTLTTGNAVASGGFITLLVGWFGAGSLSSVTGGSLTWSIDKTIANGSVHIALVSAQAAAGLASATTPDWLIGGASFLGMETTPTLLATNGAAATASAWSSGSIAAGETNLGVVMAFEDGSGTATSTSTAPLTELIDFNNAGQAEAFTYAYDLASASTATLAGSWSASLSHVARGSAFKIAAAGGGTVVKKLSALGVG
jgi:hypothetical protein